MTVKTLHLWRQLQQVKGFLFLGSAPEFMDEREQHLIGEYTAL